jgi:hypothetical protein
MLSMQTVHIVRHKVLFEGASVSSKWPVTWA